MSYEEKAIHYAEKYGIIDFKVKGNKMIYYESFHDGTYKSEVNLDTLVEGRKLLNIRKSKIKSLDKR